jgi:hypothetical protein
MDDFMGYGLVGRRHDDYSDGDATTDAAVDAFWDYKLPIYGIDTAVGQSYQS